MKHYLVNSLSIVTTSPRPSSLTDGLVTPVLAYGLPRREQPGPVYNRKTMSAPPEKPPVVYLPPTTEAYTIPFSPPPFFLFSCDLSLQYYALNKYVNIYSSITLILAGRIGQPRV